MKISSDPKSLYGRMYVQRKAIEVVQNELGTYAGQARAKLERFKIDKTTEAYAWYSGCFTAEGARALRTEPLLLKADLERQDVPTKKINQELAAVHAELYKKYKGVPLSGVEMLSPAHLNQRAKRYAVKLFLAHYFEEGYQIVLHKKPPTLYSHTMLGHMHKIEAEVKSGSTKLTTSQVSR